jgi:Flp pilus assembly secretin CpaC
MSRETIRQVRALCSTIVALMLVVSLGAQPARAQAPAPAAVSAPPMTSPAASPSSQASAAANAPPKSTPPAPDARKAREAYEQGRRAEQALDWQAAYAAESEAAEYEPTNQEYELRRYLDRFALVQQFTDRAERERIAGQSPTAREDLLRALALDPGYSVAKERLQQLEPASAVAVPVPDAELADIPKIRPQPGTRSFDLRGQTRAAYQEVARQFGLVAQFDPDLLDRPVRLQLDPMEFATVMKVLGAATHTFWRPMDAHTFFVAEDTPEKRRDFAPEIERAFVLPDSVTPDEMNETVRMIREIAAVSRATLNTASRRLTIRDTPEHVALAEALLNEIEQPHGELMLEIEILEVDHSLTRQLGITPPTSQSVYALSQSEIQSLEQAAASGTLLQAIESIFSGLGLLSATGGASAALPAVIAFGGGASTFFAPLPSATANFSDTISQVRSAQRLILRAQDGQKVSFFSGARFPVSLANLSANQSVSPTTLGTGALSGTLPTTAYPTGTDPVSVITANFNPTGSIDLAVANETANTVSILLGNGDGTFAARVDYPAGTGPAGLASGQFSSSGNPDLAVADFTGDTVSILLGNGDGTFQPATALPAGTGPIAIATGVFNNVSGHVDLAVVNQTAGTVSIFPGNGDGTFGTKTDYPVGTSPSGIAVGDFTGNGDLDLAVSNKGSNTISVLLGNGDGTFQAKTDYPVGAAPSGIVSADFNLDGKPDLAVSNQTDGTVSILLGNGNGTFAVQTTYATNADPTSLVTSDFNNDGRPDLAVTNGSANEISILLGNGDGTFESPLSFGTASQPVSIAAADFSGNDLIDAAVAASASNVVDVVLNSTTALGSSTTAFVPYPSAQYVDLGLGVHATPRINDAGDVTLDLQFEISSLAGESLNNIPVLSNRSIEQTVRLRENQTSIISGIVQSSEMGTITGWPWISQVSAVGALASNNNQQNSETDLLILITPREVRLAPHVERSIYAGAGQPGGATAAGAPEAVAPENPAPNNAPPADENNPGGNHPGPNGPGTGASPDVNNPGGNHPGPNGPGTGSPDVPPGNR